MQHLVADEDAYRTRATSTSPGAPIEVPTLGIRLAGGDRLVAEDDFGPWHDTASLAELARGQAEQVRRQTEEARRQTERANRLAEEARRQTERANRLAEALRAAGIDPDSI